jgi:hypothetical protein
MSQHDLNIANQGFPAFRADLNDALVALGSTNSGATAPATPYANQLWYDTANNILKIRNEDNDAWISIVTLDQSGDVVSAITAATVNAGALNATGNVVLGDASTDTLNVGNGDLIKDASGFVGIGNTSPQGKLDVGGVGGGSEGDFVVKTGSTAAEVIVGRISGVSSDNTSFKVRNRINEVALLVNSGDKTLQIGKSISVGGATPTTSGSGITFPATQDSSSNANTLDDYEEGTWTPTALSLSGTITSYSSNGKYTKIGNVVVLWYYIAISNAGTASSKLQITNAPFIANYDTSIAQPASVTRESSSTGNMYFTYIIGGDTLIFIQNDINGAVHWGNGISYSGILTYQSA